MGVSPFLFFALASKIPLPTPPCSSRVDTLNNDEDVFPLLTEQSKEMSGWKAPSDRQSRGRKCPGGQLLLLWAALNVVPALSALQSRLFFQKGKWVVVHRDDLLIYSEDHGRPPPASPKRPGPPP